MASRKNRRVMVAGATGTIGRAVCELLRARGDDLVLLARSEKELRRVSRELGGAAHARVIAADLSQRGAPEKAAASALRTGPVDDVVWCAGLFAREPIELVTHASMIELFAIHAVAPVLLVRALRESLAASRGAVIALSDAGVDRPFPNHTGYLAAKGAMDAAMRALAVELAPDVRVNVLRPGIITDPSSHESSRTSRLAARSLMNRFGEAAEVARVVVAMLDGTWLAGQAWTVG